MKLDVALAASIGLLVLVFMAQNYETVSVDFLLWSVSAPRAVLLLGVFFAGILIGWIVASRRARRASAHGA